MHDTQNHLSLCSIWRQLLEKHSDELLRAALNIPLACFLSDLCYPLGEGSHLHPSPGLPFSYFELSVTWIRSELYVEVVGVLAQVKSSPYLQPRPNCQGGWPRRGVQREYRWRTAADLFTRRPEHEIIIQYHRWAICMLISEKCKDLRIQPWNGQRLRIREIIFFHQHIVNTHMH